jgi:hypothetical protein
VKSRLVRRPDGILYLAAVVHSKLLSEQPNLGTRRRKRYHTSTSLNTTASRANSRFRI